MDGGEERIEVMTEGDDVETENSEVQMDHIMPPLPLALRFGDVESATLDALRQLHTTALAVRYAPRFYERLLSAPSGFARCAFHAERLIAALCARRDSSPPALYVMTLAVSAPYRCLGIGRTLLRQALTLARAHELPMAYVHVHPLAEEALRLYERHGFRVVERIPRYYSRLRPRDCLVLRVELDAHLPMQNSENSASNTSSLSIIPVTAPTSRAANRSSSAPMSIAALPAPVKNDSSASDALRR